MTTPSELPHLTVLETAALLGVHPRTVWRYAARGALTPVRHPTSRRVYFAESEVREVRRAVDARYREPRREGAPDLAGR